MTDEAAGPPPPAPAQTGGAHPPPPPGMAPPGTAPGYAPGAAGFTSRYGLVRPREGRYLAGVCAAIGRATNTDPVLWRVVLAVLGFFGGIGILVYVAAWLIIPGEGDTASPVESMLGRGRSSMSPVTVIVLSILVAVSFGFIVTDAFRAVLLGAAILIGGALLLNRDGRAPGLPAAAPVGPPFPPGPGEPTVPVQTVGQPYPGPVPPVSYPAPVLSAPPVPPGPPVVGPQPPVRGPLPPTMNPLPTVAPGPATAPVSGYRPPFAPHGPYAAPPPAPYPPVTPPVVPPVRPVKPPRERSPLGAATFSMIFVALGVVTLLDLADVVDAHPSGYFAAALATIGAGLLVGTWFGRARWLIALGLVAAAALGVATLTESYDRVRGIGGDVTWAPANHAELADRYENKFGDAVLDLRAVTFPDEVTQVTVAVSFGHTEVVVPPNVDVTTIAEVSAGEATVFGRRMSGVEARQRESTDLGPDGPGGGRLRLYVNVNAGDLEVTR